MIVDVMTYIRLTLIGKNAFQNTFSRISVEMASLNSLYAAAIQQVGGIEMTSSCGIKVFHPRLSAYSSITAVV